MQYFVAHTKSAIAPVLLAAALLTVTAVPTLAIQPPPDSGTQNGADPNAPENHLVSLDCENARLVDILPDLMKSANADYALDSSIKNVKVSLHVAGVPLKSVVAAIVKAASSPISCKVNLGLFHFTPKTEPDKPADGAPDKPAPRRPGPKYNGGDPIAAATSELITFLTGSEIALGGRNPNAQGFGGFRAGGGSLSGSRNYNDYGFINGTFGSSSYSNPDTGANNTSTRGRGGYYFGPFFSGGSGRGGR